MSRPRPRHCLLALVLGTGAAAAHDVYKCTTPHGVAYQDRPCGADAVESQLHLPDAVAPPAAPAAAAASATPEPPLPRAVPPQRAIRPLPPLWFCRNAEDGSAYVSRNGPPPPRAVPLGVLGYPGKSLAQAYAPGSNVMSAPELSKPPIDRSPQSAAAASYTQLQDSCIQANADQTCAWLRHEADGTRDKLEHARFKDEQAKLQGQLDALEQDMEGC